MSNTARESKEESTRLLIVDDEAVGRRTLSQILRLLGYQCAVAADGAQALQLVHSFHPDAVILDLLMPILDGFATCRQLKGARETHSIPIVALSASSTPEYRQQAAHAGVDAFLPKPLNVDQLLLILRQHLPASHSARGRQSC
jgi:CheY-like chemotaxis protein